MSIEDIFNLDPNETSWFVKRRLLDLLGREMNQTRIHAERYKILTNKLFRLGTEIDDAKLVKFFDIWFFSRDIKDQIKGANHIKVFEKEMKEVIEKPETDLERKLREEVKRESESGVGSVPEEDSRDVKRKKRRKASGAEGQEDTV